MTTEANSVEATFESKLENIEVVEQMAHSIAASIGFEKEDVYSIEMAVHEALINAVYHGNREDARKQVRVQFLIHPDRLEIRIHDEGEGFDLGKIEDPLTAQNLLKKSGRGIFLVRAFMDEFWAERNAGSGTEVILVKRLPSKIEPSQGGP